MSPAVPSKARFPPGKVDTRGWIPVGEAAKQPDVPNRHTHHEELGKQLQRRPVLLDVGGNPLGFAGLRQVRVMHLRYFKPTAVGFDLQ